MRVTRVLPMGRRALLLEVGGTERAQALHAELVRLRETGELPPVEEIVPAAATVLLDGLEDPGSLTEWLRDREFPDTAPAGAAAVVLPVRYDGPDLAGVAALWGVDEEEAVAIHTRTEFRVAFCGFAPGFGYLTGLPEELGVPRRTVPRTSVPPGSVGLAGAYTGVYPRTSPGGWQLIGRTDAVLWDVSREPAALLAPGARVRFEAVP
ncbi:MULTISPECIES: 5-oxoprolinase subunit B family protein [Streptomyces]|uniref:Sensor histidine kinase inhibitor, KipI family n=1 Tax=Streptomyces radiopugnans TaxID=403935 RepID=A0A1H9FHA1_9ACTN|nr:allophanate hydrolase subunit 1 [Streptomyces radiopugnans]SEQ37292.1 sensor histidine kinase inhibitor, KipI family [Streptomyces radiopugnans]